MKAKSIEVKVCSSTCVTNHLNVWSLGNIVKDKALDSPFGGSMHWSDIWNDVQKHRVYIRAPTLRCVCVPGFQTSALTFSFILHTEMRNREARGPDNQGQIWTKCAVFRAPASGFLQVGPRPLSYWRKTMTSGLLGHSVLILPFFGIWTPRTLEEQNRPDNRGGESEAKLGGRMDLCPFYCSPADVYETLCPDLLN